MPSLDPNLDIVGASCGSNEIFHLESDLIDTFKTLGKSLLE